MPRAGPLRQMLNALSVKELRAVRRGFCPKVNSYSEQDGKNSFVGSIRDSLKRSIEKNEVSYYELMQFLMESHLHFNMIVKKGKNETKFFEDIKAYCLPII